MASGISPSIKKMFRKIIDSFRFFYEIHSDVKTSSASMQLVTDPLPENINTAEVLEIKHGCVAADVFHIIVNRSNIKTVIVCDRTYVSKEIANMLSSDVLGDLPASERLNPIPVPTAPGNMYFDEEELRTRNPARRRPTLREWVVNAGAYTTYDAETYTDP